MATELIINASLPETRIALTEDGEIQELLIERATGKGIVGNIYKGRVTRVLPGMQAAFVDIGLEKAAFLYVDDVFVHSDIFDDDEGSSAGEAENETETVQAAGADDAPAPVGIVAVPQRLPEPSDEEVEAIAEELEVDDVDEDDVSEDDDGQPMGMDLPPGGDGDSGGGDVPAGTVAPPAAAGAEGADGPRRHRRGRRGGRNRERSGERGGGGRGPKRPQAIGAAAPAGEEAPGAEMPDSYEENMGDGDKSGIERPSMEEGQGGGEAAQEGGRPSGEAQAGRPERAGGGTARGRKHPEFNEQRGRDRRVRSKASIKPVRGQVNIQDLLQEGQEVIVQVAKDPIATKGARLTCHISLPGRHLVCMPTIDHVGVSRRIDRDEERRRLRDFVERNRPKKLGFIVRTASGKSAQSEKRIKQDIDYLTRLWEEIRGRASQVSAPALVYEDLNSVLRAIRDWVTEEIDKIVVDSRYHHQEILKFVSHFMPSLRQKLELYHGDIPIFDAYGISTELSRSLESKVWLKSGGYIVIDQAEALVAIDV